MKDMKAKTISITHDPDALLSEEGAARFLNVSTRFLQKHRTTGDGPNFVKISSRCIRYRRSDLVSWSGALVRTSTSAA